MPKHTYMPQLKHLKYWVSKQLAIIVHMSSPIYILRCLHMHRKMFQTCRGFQGNRIKVEDTLCLSASL